jgi:hypothetical protein
MPAFSSVLSVLVLLAALTVGCNRVEQPADLSAEVEDSGNAESFTTADLVTPLEHQPLAYFQNHCERCHGPWGAFYGDSFGEGLSEDELKEIVDEMAAGPAGAPLEGEELAGQVAFHRSLLAKAPFLVFEGEVTPGSEVRLTWPGGELAAEVEDFRWTLELPSDLDQKPALIAELDGATTRLDPTRTSFSHAD